MAHKGRKKSEEWKKKIGDANKRRWEEKRLAKSRGENNVSNQKW